MSTLSSDERNKLNDSDFGIPEKRMYPLNDKEHVEAACKLFGHASNKDKPKLAKRILRKAREYGINTSNWENVNAWAKKLSIQEEYIDDIDDEYIEENGPAAPPPEVPHAIVQQQPEAADAQNKQIPGADGVESKENLRSNIRSAMDQLGQTAKNATKNVNDSIPSEVRSVAKGSIELYLKTLIATISATLTVIGGIFVIENKRLKKLRELKKFNLNKYLSSDDLDEEIEYQIYKYEIIDKSINNYLESLESIMQNGRKINLDDLRVFMRQYLEFAKNLHKSYIIVKSLQVNFKTHTADDIDTVHSKSHSIEDCIKMMSHTNFRYKRFLEDYQNILRFNLGDANDKSLSELIRISKLIQEYFANIKRVSQKSHLYLRDNEYWDKKRKEKGIYEPEQDQISDNDRARLQAQRDFQQRQKNQQIAANNSNTRMVQSQESYIPLSEFDHYFQEGTFTTSKNVKKRVETAMDDVILGLNAIHEALSNNKWSKVDFANFWTTHTTFTPSMTFDTDGNITGGGQFNTSGKNFKYSLGMLLDYVTLASKRRRTKAAFTESELTTLAEYRKDILKYRTLCDSAIRGMKSYDVNLKDVDKATVEFLEKSKKITAIVSSDDESKNVNESFVQEGWFTNAGNVKKRINEKLSNVFSGFKKIHNRIENGEWTKRDWKMFWSSEFGVDPSVGFDTSGQVSVGFGFNSHGEDFRLKVGDLINDIDKACKKEKLRVAFTEEELMKLIKYSSELKEYSLFCDSSVHGKSKHDIMLEDIDEKTVDIIEKTESIKDIFKN